MIRFIKAEDFALQMDDLFLGHFPKKIAVAVSGGADSMCLTMLLDEWARAKKIKLFAFTVDHGLRAESAKEAQDVHEFLTARGIWHETLLWTGKKPTAAIEEKAREARYDLLITACKKQGIEHLCIAHHQNDQAETFWLRLVRSSGVDGLAAMQKCTKRQGVYILRPLLDYDRVLIQRTLTRRFKIDHWVEDPSNKQSIFERVRIRNFQRALDKVHLTTAVVARSAKRLYRARVALDYMADVFIQKNVKKDPAGFVFVKKKPFCNMPEEIQLRVLNKLISYVAGADYIPRMAQMEKLLEKMPDCVTVAGCQIVPKKNGFFVCTESSKMPDKMALKANRPARWGRFEVVCDHDVWVAPMGAAFKKNDLPSFVRRSIPAFFDKKGLAFVPTLDYKRKNTDINGSVQIKE